MTKPLKTLQDVMDKFDKEFVLTENDYQLMAQRGIFGGKKQIKNIKQFLTTSITELLDQLVEPQVDESLCRAERHRSKHLFCKTCTENKAHNTLARKINKQINEIKGL